MTAALEKQILASQKFLGTVRHLPSFPEARDKQVENLLKKISKTPVQVEHAAALVELLDSSIWGSHVDALKSAVIVEEASQKKNVALQDYLALPHYLTTGLWKALGEDTRRVALEKICKHCKLLGLSNPSEVTQAMILVLVFDVEGHMLGSQQWQVTLREKGNVQKCLKQSVLHSAEHHLLALPQNREECPAELWTRAFGAETPVESQWPYEDLLKRAKDWPMRSTHRFAQGVLPVSMPVPSTAVSQAAGAEMMHQMGSFMAGLLHGQKPTEEAPLPGFKLMAKPEAKTQGPEQSVPVLALEDKKEEVTNSAAPAVEEKQEPSQAPSSGKAAVSATLAALQVDVVTETKAPKRKVSNQATLKKPAASSKMPASAQKNPAVKKRPAAALRRPAAASSQVEQETRAQRRLRLIQERILVAEQRRFRGGCPTCYYRKGCTLSCWQKRGYNMEE